MKCTICGREIVPGEVVYNIEIREAKALPDGEPDIFTSSTLGWECDSCYSEREEW